MNNNLFSLVIVDSLLNNFEIVFLIRKISSSFFWEGNLSNHGIFYFVVAYSDFFILDFCLDSLGFCWPSCDISDNGTLSIVFLLILHNKRLQLRSLLHNLSLNKISLELLRLNAFFHASHNKKIRRIIKTI